MKNDDTIRDPIEAGVRSGQAEVFTCVLVPYDGSEPARSALTLALAILPASSRLVVVTAVDRRPVFDASAQTTAPSDPAHGRALLADAVERCRVSKVTPLTELMHGTPVQAIVTAMRAHGADLVVMGTHARVGVSRMFLGSTTEGVLRSSSVPVMTVRARDPLGRNVFATALLGIDESDASDAGAALAATLARIYKSHVVACCVVDVAQLYRSGASYPNELQSVLAGMKVDAAANVAHALQRAALDGPAATVAIVEGKAAEMLLETALQYQATVMVVGSHGRRGMRRLFLGSVAETVIRGSAVPVLVVRGSS